MAQIDHYTFSADGTMPGEFIHLGQYSQLTIGEVDAEDFGGGTLLIQKETLNGSRSTIRSISAGQFIGMQDKTIRLELSDGLMLYIELTGATDPNLYVEHRNQQRVNGN